MAWELDVRVSNYNDRMEPTDKKASSIDQSALARALTHNGQMLQRELFGTF